MKKSYLLAVIAVIVILAGLYWLYNQNQNQPNNQATDTNSVQNLEPSAEPAATTTDDNQLNDKTMNDDKQTTTTADGLQIKILRAGAGAAAKAGDKVSVHYTGTFTDGKKFDSSVDRGLPFAFTLGAGEVIKGWDEGVAGMQVGEKRQLTVPYQLGYGENGYSSIPPKATLLFDVELLKIN